MTINPNAPHPSSALPGVLLRFGEVGEPARSRWESAAREAGLLLIQSTRADECALHASGKRPVCLLTHSATLREGGVTVARIADPADRVFQRIAVVMVVDGPGDADHPKRTVWDTLSAGAGEDAVRATLASAITAAEQRVNDWETADEFHRRRDSLTHDEAAVFQAVCLGKLNKQIAAELEISIRTVEQRRRRVFTKMGVESAIPLARVVGMVEALDRHKLRRDTPHAGPGTGEKPPIIGSPSWKPTNQSMPTDADRLE